MLDAIRFSIMAKERQRQWCCEDLREARADLKGNEEDNELKSEVKRLADLRRSIGAEVDGPGGLDAQLQDARIKLEAATAAPIPTDEVEADAEEDPVAPGPPPTPTTPAASLSASGRTTPVASVEAAEDNDEAEVAHAQAQVDASEELLVAGALNRSIRDAQAHADATQERAVEVSDTAPPTKKRRREDVRTATPKASSTSSSTATPKTSSTTGSTEYFEVEVLKSRWVKGKWKFKVEWIGWEGPDPIEWISKHSLGVGALKAWKLKNGGNIKMQEEDIVTDDDDAGDDVSDSEVIDLCPGAKRQLPMSQLLEPFWPKTPNGERYSTENGNKVKGVFTGTEGDITTWRPSARSAWASISVTDITDLRRTLRNDTPVFLEDVFAPSGPSNLQLGVMQAVQYLYVEHKDTDLPIFEITDFEQVVIDSILRNLFKEPAKDSLERSPFRKWVEVVQAVHGGGSGAASHARKITTKHVFSLALRAFAGTCFEWAARQCPSYQGLGPYRLPLAAVPLYLSLYRLPLYRSPLYRSPLYRLPLYRCTAYRLPLYRCTAVPLYRCTAVPLYRLPLYRCTAVPLTTVRSLQFPATGTTTITCRGATTTTRCSKWSGNSGTAYRALKKLRSTFCKRSSGSTTATATLSGRRMSRRRTRIRGPSTCEITAFRTGRR